LKKQLTKTKEEKKGEKTGISMGLKVAWKQNGMYLGETLLLIIASFAFFSFFDRLADRYMSFWGAMAFFIILFIVSVIVILLLATNFSHNARVRV